MGKWSAALAVIGCLAGAGVGAGGGAISAQAAARTVPQTGFLSAPTEQLAVPGQLASGEITPEGDIYTGWAEYQLLIGHTLQAFNQPTRIAPDPSAPRYIAQLRRGPITYQEQVFTVDVNESPVVYLSVQATNDSRQRQTATIGMQLEYTRGQPIPTFDGTSASPYRFPRPISNAASGFGYEQELGEVFDPSWQYSVIGRDVDRDGQLLLRGPAASSEQHVAISADSLTSPHARQIYRRPVRGSATTSWTWQIPLDPPLASASIDASFDAAPISSAQPAFQALWHKQLAGAMSIALPEHQITDIYRESLVNILASRILTDNGWLQAVNKFQYQAYWLRDSSVMTVALDQANLHTTAGENLGLLPAWQLPNGLFISQRGEYDGIGEALWEMNEHAQLTDSASYASSVLPSVSAAVNWIAGQTGSDPNGLLPPSTISADQPIAAGYVAGDNLWTAMGLRSAMAIAAIADRSDLVSAWQGLDTTFEGHLRSALQADQDEYGHITPVLGQTDAADWGNYSLDYPLEIAPINSTMTTSILAWEHAHSNQGLADYGGAGFLHGYLGFPIFQTELERGGLSVARAIAGLYAEAGHTTATGAGWELGPVGTGVRASADNLAPHGTFAGQYISFLHNLLVNDQDNRVTLLAGVSPAWMAAGDHISVARASTSAGLIRFHLQVSATGARLQWSLNRYPDNQEPLYWALPYWVDQAQLPNGRLVDRSVMLPSDSGNLQLDWSAQRPTQSLAQTETELDSLYTSNHHQAPLQPAHDW
jgi:hypothetical protein